MSAEPLTREDIEALDAECQIDLADGYMTPAHAQDIRLLAAAYFASESGRRAAEERADALERLIDYAMLLHEHGEAPPGYELATWGGWYRSVREFFGHERADDAKRCEA